MKREIIVFGAGKVAIENLPKILDKHEVSCILDNNEQLWGSRLLGIEICSPQILMDHDSEEILILSGYWREISRQLYTEYGIRKAYILGRSEGAVDSKSDICFREINCTPLYTGMNHEREKETSHILFIAYYFPPIGASPIQRTLKFIKYLSGMGYKITVLTVKDTGRSPIDKSLLKDIPDGVEVVRFLDRFDDIAALDEYDQREIINHISLIDNSSDFIAQYESAQSTQDRYTLPDSLLMWGIEAWKKMGRYVDINSVDIVYSTVPELTPHLLGYLFKRCYGIPWIADYRDPWVASDEYIKGVYPWMTSEEISWNRRLESKIISAMDHIIIAGENWRKLFVDTYGVEDDKITTITNGYDEDDFDDLDVSNVKNSKFTICYNGALGYNRKPRYLLEVISSLIDEGAFERDDVVWIFNGPLSEEVRLNEIEKYDRHNIAKINGMLDHRESLKVLVNSDVNVLYGDIGHMSKLNYPGKTYEYLRAGKPILCFSTPGSVLDEIISECESGVNLDLEDTEGMRRFLLKYYDMWKNGGIKASTNGSIAKYSRLECSKKLAKTIGDKS